MSLFRSPHHPWSAKMQATHIGSRPGQCSVHLCPSYASDRHWPLRNVGHCVNTDLCDTAKCYSTISIFIFDQILWQMAMITIKNKPEPSLHGIMVRLGGFYTPVSYLEAVSGSGLWSLLAFNPWDSPTSRDYWEPSQEADHEMYRSRWQCHRWGCRYWYQSCEWVLQC